MRGTVLDALEFNARVIYKYKICVAAISSRYKFHYILVPSRYCPCLQANLQMSAPFYCVISVYNVTMSIENMQPAC